MMCSLALKGTAAAALVIPGGGTTMTAPQGT
eukprot:CAMPEP_0183292058 /NCGR_PEP_ID=MMETSP0160_2-20130417/1267_1 /TAXON_ID=2839 ORGANISM="Odontella Sinensis, Strain Grunow 1884" /NCGR_SAMPLE_ID=MMETSP0160_2 /ASSEMBLY_ACC=CAM_ASM_000250 /LENGTH=30 /DNA_ID= /DNA_START= /DNA_END= /DNA_ORIENTATION=